MAELLQATADRPNLFGRRWPQLGAMGQRRKRVGKFEPEAVTGGSEPQAGQLGDLPAQGQLGRSPGIEGWVVHDLGDVA
jgi:hypothetical protein